MYIYQSCIRLNISHPVRMRTGVQFNGP